MTSDYQSNYTNSRLIRDIWRPMAGQRRRFAFSSIGRLISDLLWLYPAIALAQIVDAVTSLSADAATKKVTQVLIIFTIVAILRYIIREFTKYFGYLVSERTALNAQQATLQKLLALDLSWHERENAGNKLKRMQHGALGINDIMRAWYDDLIETTVYFIGAVIVVATFDVAIAVGMLVYIAIYWIVSHRLTTPGAKAAREVNVTEETILGLQFEIVNNIRTVKVLNLSRALARTMAQRFEQLFTKIRRRVFWFRTRGGVLGTYSTAVRIGFTAIIAFGVIHQQYQVGFLVLFNNYFNRIWQSLDDLSNAIQQIVVSKYSIARMTEILDTPLPDTSQAKHKFPLDWQRIELRNVSFKYHRQAVLTDISLTIRRGQKLGIVGLSGAGKSTLFKLLLKEHETYQGDILVDGLPLREINRNSYLARAAVVLQDTEVFNFSLRENITIAAAGRRTSRQALRRAVEVAHVQDFLDKLPNGLDTAIGEKGVKLSGGERQRLGIARAVYKQPDILFLDEATSHLDATSEANIRASLETVFQSVTAVVIAHRLSTIQEMDQIVVIEHGKLIEQGTFAELQQAKGRFHSLWKQQKL